MYVKLSGSAISSASSNYWMWLAICALIGGFKGSCPITIPWFKDMYVLFTL